MEVTYLANLDGLSWLPQLLPEWNSKQMSEKIIVGMLCSRTQKFIFFQWFSKIFPWLAHEKGLYDGKKGTT